MALQGTIDAFPIADVLHLLAGSHKTGRLIVDGDRSTAQLFVVDGSLTDGSVRDGTVSDLADVVVELLRYGAGSFLFEPGSLAPQAGPATDLDVVLAVASERLAAWREIEARVPSMAHRLRLVEVIAVDEVQISGRDWLLIVAAGRETSIADVVAASGESQIETCSRIVGLVDRGLVTVEGPKAELVPVDDRVAPHIEPERAGGPDVDPTAVEEAPAFEVVLIEDDLVEDVLVEDVLVEDVLVEDEPMGDVFPDRFPIDDLLASDEEEDPWVQLEAAAREERLAAAQSFDNTSFDDTSFDGASAHDGDPAAGFTTAFDGSGAFTDAPSGMPRSADQAADSAADEVLRQMSKLSPKAAEAIAAALGSTGEPVTEDTVF